jgi:hypothetical protein
VVRLPPQEAGVLLSDFYIWVRERVRVARTVEVADGLHVDFAADGSVIGIELLGVDPVSIRCSRWMGSRGSCACDGADAGDPARGSRYNSCGGADALEEDTCCTSRPTCREFVTA